MGDTNVDEKLKQEFDALRAELKKNVEALARVDKLEAAAGQRDADVKKIQGDMEAIRAEAKQREDTIRELQQKARVQAIQRDPIRERQDSIRMLGMIVRQELSKHLRVEVPAAFKEEGELVRSYHESISRATLYAGGTTGSYLVPTITEATVIDALEEVSELLGLVDFVPGLPAASTISIPTLVTRPTLQAARASVDTAMTQSDPAFGQLQLTPAEAYIYFPVDNRLIQMSAVALGNLLAQVLRDGLISGICTWLLSGDATSTYNSVRGILKENTAAYIYQLGSGKTGFANLAKSDLTGMKAKCLKRGRGPRGRWLTSLDVLGIIEDLDRTGKTPVITYGQDGMPRVLQNEVVIEEGMPDIADSAADTGFIGFGDWATYLVGLIEGIQIASSSDYLFGKNQTAFRGVLNMDIKRKPVATAILGKTAAA